MLVKLGGEAGPANAEACEPSPGASQFMHTTSAMLPQLRWSVVRLVSGLDEPLLPDEEAAIEAAAVVVLEVCSPNTVMASICSSRAP